MTLYTYCLRYDDGAAPNPYWGVCTLAICKPAIRRTASKGDWIVGIGSRDSLIGDISRKVVYAMRLTRDPHSMARYDESCRGSLIGKIPDWESDDFRRKVGDCIYDFSEPGPPKLRRSVHKESNRERDLSGKNVLLSDHFYYFGDKPVGLPDDLLPIIHPTQGHRSLANAPYLDRFVEWIEGGGWPRNALLGEPQLKAKIMSMSEAGCRSLCSRQHAEDDEVDAEGK